MRKGTHAMRLNVIELGKFSTACLPAGVEKIMREAQVKSNAAERRATCRSPRDEAIAGVW